MLSHISVEFLDNVLVIYKDLLAGKVPKIIHVPTSISMKHPASLPTEERNREEMQQDGVEASTLAQCIDALCDMFKCR